ncbi:MAG: DUF427 domain-containing protein [Planctomycetota bacterium]
MRHPKRIEPGPGQESVWDYPRPPRLEPVGQRVTVELAGKTIADSMAALRVLETSHPPTIYIPPADVRLELLAETGRSSACEWKGRATYADLVVGDVTRREAAWTYRSPVPSFAGLKDHWSFYPSRVDRCTIGDWVVEAQEGDFYGGWKTPNLVGPFKGGAGTWGW